MPSIRIFILLCFLFLTNIASHAQSPAKTGNWIMLFNQLRVHDKWSIHNEFQYRSFGIKPNTEQTLFRIGLNYHLPNSAVATFGYGNILNFTANKDADRSIQVFENRLWQQLLMRNNTGRFFFDHRYRLEQRWLITDSSTRYLNRARALLRLTVPLNKKSVEANTWFVSFYNEIFIHFTKTPFDRNRLYGAIGYRFAKDMNLQAGYLAQTLSTGTKSYLQTALTYNFDLRKNRIKPSL